MFKGRNCFDYDDSGEFESVHRDLEDKVSFNRASNVMCAATLDQAEGKTRPILPKS